VERLADTFGNVAVLRAYGPAVFAGLWVTIEVAGLTVLAGWRSALCSRCCDVCAGACWMC
jgi:hypothetical protein